MERRPGTPSLLRELNDRAALDLLLPGTPLTRTQISEQTRVSKVTVAQMLARLEERGLVTVVGQQEGGRGPNAALYSVVPASAYVRRPRPRSGRPRRRRRPGGRNRPRRPGRGRGRPHLSGQPPRRAHRRHRRAGAARRHARRRRPGPHRPPRLRLTARSRRTQHNPAVERTCRAPSAPRCRLPTEPTSGAVCPPSRLRAPSAHRADVGCPRAGLPGSLHSTAPLCAVRPRCRRPSPLVTGVSLR